MDSLDWLVQQIFFGAQTPWYIPGPDKYQEGTELWIKHAGLPTIYPDNIQAGDRVFPQVKSTPVPDLYGLSFTLEFDTMYWIRLGNGASYSPINALKQSRLYAGGKINSEFSLYPNPVRESLTLLAPEQHWESIKVFDSTGRLLRVWGEGGQDQMALDLSGLPGGCLFLQVLTGGRVETFRLLKVP